MDLDILTEIVKATPGVLIAAAVAYYFSQRRYTFEKLYDRKLLYLEEIFEMVVLFEDYVKKYTLTTGSVSVMDRKRDLKTIQDHFFELRKLFRKTEIIFDQKTVDAVRSFIDSANDVLSNLAVSNLSSQNGDDNSAIDFWKDACFEIKNKLSEAKEMLKANFREVMESNR